MATLYLTPEERDLLDDETVREIEAAGDTIVEVEDEEEAQRLSLEAALGAEAVAVDVSSEDLAHAAGSEGQWTGKAGPEALLAEFSEHTEQLSKLLEQVRLGNNTLLRMEASMNQLVWSFAQAQGAEVIWGARAGAFTAGAVGPSIMPSRGAHALNVDPKTGEISPAWSGPNFEPGIEDPSDVADPREPGKQTKI